MCEHMDIEACPLLPLPLLGLVTVCFILPQWPKPYLTPSLCLYQANPSRGAEDGAKTGPL